MEHKEKILYDEDGKTQEQIVQRNCECPMTGTIQEQIGHGFGHPDLGKDLPIHGRMIGLDYLECFLSIQTNNNSVMK